MKPWTSFVGLAKWLLRIAMFFVIFTQYYESFMAFELNRIAFYASAIFLIFGVLLLVGGFLSRHNLTVISGLMIFLVSIYASAISFDGITSEFALNILIGSVALLFLTDGNK